MSIDECKCAPVVLIVLAGKCSVPSTKYDAQLLEVHMANATFYLFLLIRTSNMLPIKYAVSWGPLGCVFSFGGRQNFYFPLIT